MLFFGEFEHDVSVFGVGVEVAFRSFVLFALSVNRAFAREYVGVKVLRAARKRRGNVAFKGIESAVLTA